MQKKHIFIFLLIFSIFSCQSQIDRLKTVGELPKLNKVSLPMTEDNYSPVEWVEEDKTELKNNIYSLRNSLWNSKSKFFLQDTNPRRVGDIITVSINISDKAELDNNTKRSRKSKDLGGNPILLGIEKAVDNVLPFGINPLGEVSINSNTDYEGNGEIDREEIISTQIAAMITQILPNGNLVIHGKQEINVNYEIRQISIDGIIRQQDISVSNSISSEQIAEARILYGGRGNLSEAQQPKIGSQVMDIIYPF